MGTRFRFWKKVFEVPVEILLCFVAGSLGVLTLPLIILWNLTFERNGILTSVQADIEREERDKKARETYPVKNPVPFHPRGHFEKWADESQGYILGGVSYRDVDSGFVYNDDTTHAAWEGFQEGTVYGEKITLEELAHQFGVTAENMIGNTQHGSGYRQALYDAETVIKDRING
jgi:hypothetical protein